MADRLVIDADGNQVMLPQSEADIAQAAIDHAAWQAKVQAALHQAVKDEAQRRIVGMTGAPDLQTCMIKQLNALMRAAELTNKKASGQTLSDEENAQAAALQALADGISAIRGASNAIEAMTPIPADFANDSYWGT